jgi:hypothetical protein
MEKIRMIEQMVMFVAILSTLITAFLVLLIFAAGVGVTLRLVVDKSLVPDFVAVAKGLRRLFGKKQVIVGEKV